MESSPLARASKRSSAAHQPPNTSRRRLEPDDHQQPWTAARCQRLLRQLQARLAALKRLNHSQPTDRTTHSKREADENSARPATKRVRLTYGHRNRALASVTGGAIPDTDNTPPRPTRALRAMRPGLSSPISGPADFRTPLWKRIRARTDTPLHKHHRRELDLTNDDDFIARVPASLMDGMRLFKKTISDDHYKLYEAVFDGVHALLRSTSQEAHQMPSKSLLAMCLRKVPACIAHIQEWDRHQAKGRQSSWDPPLVASDVYGQLERFGSQEGGWRPLSLVVRSQTVTILADAIYEGLLHPSFTGILVRLCSNLNCLEEGAKLACSMGNPLPEPRSLKSTLSQDDRLQPLFALFRCGLGEKPTSFIFECMASVLENRLLPGAWLCTMDFTDLWSKNLEGMVSNNAKPSILRFKRAAMVLLARCEKIMPESRRSVAQKTLHGILAGSTAVALTIEQGLGAGSSLKGKQAFRRFLHLLDGAIAQLSGSRHRNGLFVLMLARCLTVVDSGLVHGCHARQAVEDFQKGAIGIHASARQDGRYRSMVSLISEVVLCLRRSESFDGLGEIGPKLDRLQLPDWLVKATRKDVAFQVAKRTKSLKDLAFAESLPFVSDSSGWRWEEGISEWVVVDTEADQATAMRKRGLRSQTSQSCSIIAKSRGAKALESRISSLGSASGRECRADGGGTRCSEKAPIWVSSSEHDLGRRPLIRTRSRPALANLSQKQARDDERDELL